MTDSRRAEGVLREEVEAHRAALAELVALAEGVEDAAWNAPLAEGAWSPAQVVEHLRLTYVAVRGELAGNGGMRLRMPAWKRLPLRLLVLRPILRRGRFPRGAPAVREIRPAEGPFERQALVAALREEGVAFLDAASSAPAGARITHPFLGALGVADGVRFLAHHLRHHRRQLVPPLRQSPPP